MGGNSRKKLEWTTTMATAVAAAAVVFCAVCIASTTGVESFVPRKQNVKTYHHGQQQSGVKRLVYGDLRLEPPPPATIITSSCHFSTKSSSSSSASSSSSSSSSVAAAATAAAAAAAAADSTDTSAAATAAAAATTVTTRANTKFRRLRDRMWMRETLEDLTAAEFACTLDAASAEVVEEEKSSSTISSSGKKAKPPPKVDFEQLDQKLEKRIEELCCKEEGCTPNEPFAIRTGLGMGSMMYSDEQRNSLLQRLLSTKENLKVAMDGHVPQEQKLTKEAVQADLADIREQLQPEDNRDEKEEKEKQMPTTATTTRRSASTKGIQDPNVYVRDDGTVDWDGALQDREALRKFGTAVWARINGQDPETVTEDSIGSGTGDEAGANGGGDGARKAVTAKIIETEEIRKQKTSLDALQEKLREMEVQHTALLNSAISAGQAVANINMATLDPGLRARIRSSSRSLEKMREEVSFQTLTYELERIYTYLDREMGNTATKGYIPLQDRLNIAEFGLFESQVASLNAQLEEGETLDADVLAVILDQLVDFKRRLGIDYYVTGLTYDREAIQRWFSELLDKAKSGFAFYVKGCRLFWNDIVFCLALIGRASGGYTLKPREVRTLRRTFKDVITFIPVVIILIIPLSPVGHVMVFGAIQRFFPDFFPSCFTERRQNLLQLYESTEFSEVTIDESFKEKLVRFFQAFAFVLASSAKNLYGVINGSKDDDINEK